MTPQPRLQPQPLQPRRFQRVRVTLFGRYCLGSREEHRCLAVNMSPGDMLLFAKAKPAIGAGVVVYLDNLGRFPGVVTRETPDAFAMTFKLPAKKRDVLADKLTWLTNRYEVGLDENRRSERIVPFRKRAILRESGGRERIVQIRDLSLDGVDVEIADPPAVGAKIVLGGTPLTVVRHSETGFAGQFAKPFEVGEINEMVRL